MDIIKSKYDYEVHPLAKLFPLLPDEEYQKLKADIKAHGQLEPIMLSKDGTMLLDGRNRLRACKELEINPTVSLVSWSSYKGISEADFIWSANVLRRHLTADQRAAIAHKWSDVEKEAAADRQKASQAKPGEKVGSHKVRVNPPAPSRDRHATRKAIAKKARVSEHKVRQVEVVAKRAPELLAKVETGEVKLKDAVATVAPPVKAKDVEPPTKQPASSDTQLANSHKERMVTALGAMSSAVKGLTEVLDVTRIASAFTPTELKEWMWEIDNSANELSKFGTKLLRAIDQVHEVQRRDGEASPAA